MKKHLTTVRGVAYTIALFASASSLVFAQTTLSAQTTEAIASQAIPAASTSALAEQQGSSSGVAYISGGAGVEERGAMDAKRSQFPLKLVVSAAKGEFVVADTVRLIDSTGKTVLDASGVGPWVMIKAPIGSYRLEVGHLGKTQTKRLKLGGKPSQVNLRFAKSG